MTGIPDTKSQQVLDLELKVLKKQALNIYVLLEEGKTMSLRNIYRECCTTNHNEAAHIKGQT